MVHIQVLGMPRRIRCPGLATQAAYAQTRSPISCGSRQLALTFFLFTHLPGVSLCVCPLVPLSGLQWSGILGHVHQRSLLGSEACLLEAHPPGRLCQVKEESLSLVTSPAQLH